MIINHWLKITNESNYVINKFKPHDLFILIEDVWLLLNVVWWIDIFDMWCDAM